ncbi:PH domain-containing protein [Nocardia bovistercoris]|uniref:PH domain-containing protein n=1 Tax=Nocardia bovistercoris TaxID=2785916 RepID=A0A931N520_9NOCA|nr:PH domain-containing protein [Nocardia bovistercoris]
MKPESDESPDTPGLAWTTPAPALYAVAAGAVILAGAAVLSNDNAGRLLIGLAALGLLALAVLGFRQRPRVSILPGADPRLVVRNLTGPTEYAPEQIVRARIVGYRRLGRKMPMLEIDVREAGGAEHLLIFGRWDLGTHPEDVFDALLANGLATR